jgi:hypothetical protein
MGFSFGGGPTPFLGLVYAGGVFLGFLPGMLNTASSPALNTSRAGSV